eukprot:966819_1
MLVMKERTKPVSNVVDSQSPVGNLPLTNDTHLAKYDTTVEDLELINDVLSYDVNDTIIVTSAGFDEEIVIEEGRDEYDTGQWYDDDEDVIQEIITADIIDDEECTPPPPPPNVPECEAYNDYDEDEDVIQEIITADIIDDEECTPPPPPPNVP